MHDTVRMLDGPPLAADMFEPEVKGQPRVLAVPWQFWLVDLANAINTIATRVRSGAGDPEGVVTAHVGTLYLRTDGGVGSTLYVKEANDDNTGWAPK